MIRRDWHTLRIKSKLSNDVKNRSGGRQCRITYVVACSSTGGSEKKTCSVRWKLIVPTDFEPQHLLTIQAYPRSAGYSAEKIRVYFEDAVRRLETLPGVTSATASTGNGGFILFRPLKEPTRFESLGTTSRLDFLKR
ncbi:MAG: hypothetical protein DMG13_27040 [Acidobacteria bacterium]|nr:MAG: hypothetical protein DMG13_27040 [Acidobacteriota bacterium]